MNAPAVGITTLWLITMKGSVEISSLGHAEKLHLDGLFLICHEGLYPQGATSD